MPQFEDVADLNSNLVRKVLQGTVFLAPWEVGDDSTVVESLADNGGIEIPAGYDSVGWISEDGLTLPREEEVNVVPAWGSATALRRDIQTSTKSMQFSAMETKRLTKELQLGMDLSNTDMSTYGEVVITEPANPVTKYWRVLAIGTDGVGDDRVYFARHFSKGSVSERDDEVWSDGEAPLAYNVTMEANLDDDAGFAVREFIFGPGALALAEAMNWSVSS